MSESIVERYMRNRSELAARTTNALKTPAQYSAPGYGTFADPFCRAQQPQRQSKGDEPAPDGSMRYVEHFIQRRNAR